MKRRPGAKAPCVAEFFAGLKPCANPKNKAPIFFQQHLSGPDTVYESLRIFYAFLIYVELYAEFRLNDYSKDHGS
jgi:hypothetical protein